VTKKITTWEPDTCGCIVEYSWDSESEEDTRVHNFHGHSRRCHDHEHLWNEDVYQTVLEENQRRQLTLQHAAQHTQLGRNFESKDRGGRPATLRQLRPDITHSFFYTHQGEETETGPNKPRVLHLTFSEDMPQQHKSIIEQRFPGLVKVH
jgi:hypothetical protein